MFVPVPVLAIAGLVVLVMIVHIVRLSRERDLMRGGSSLRPIMAAERKDPLAAPAVTLPPDIEVQVRALVRGGRTVEAIKLVREVTRLGLRESKELVEAL